VDVVLEFGDLALRYHRDRPRQVAAGNGGRNLGDCTHLRRQVSGELVDVLGQVTPRAGNTGNFGLTTELAFRTHFARNTGHLCGVRRQLVDHRVDRVLQFEDLALRVDGDLL